MIGIKGNDEHVLRYGVTILLSIDSSNDDKTIF